MRVAISSSAPVLIVIVIAGTMISAADKCFYGPLVVASHDGFKLRFPAWATDEEIALEHDKIGEALLEVEGPPVRVRRPVAKKKAPVALRDLLVSARKFPPVRLWRLCSNLPAKHERLEGRHVHDAPIETEPTDDLSNDVEITGARGVLRYLSQAFDLGLGKV